MICAWCELRDAWYYEEYYEEWLCIQCYWQVKDFLKDNPIKE